MLLSLLLCIAHPPVGHWATDETGKVSSSAIASFEATAQALDDSGAGQLGLAVVKTTKGVPPREFATRVFNQWGVGHHGRNDGVLLFFALDDRKAEIVLGDGFPSEATSTTDVIMRDEVVANMKAGRLDDAVTRAASALASFVKSALAGAMMPPSSSEPLTPEQQLLEYVVAGKAALPEKSPREWTIDLGHTLQPGNQAMFDREGDRVYAAGKGPLFIVFSGSRLDFGAVARELRRQTHKEGAWVVGASVGGMQLVVDGPEHEADAHDIELHAEMMRGLPAVLEAVQATATLAVDGPAPVPMTVMATQLVNDNLYALLGVLGGGGLLGLVSVKSWMRRRPRECRNCGNPRHRLSEETDDPHLNAGQQLEESLGSVDYDVWWCGRCNDALVLRFGAIFTRYSICSGCDFKTMSSSSTTLVFATYDHGGTVQVTETCRKCPHVHTYTRHTSRLTRSSSSSSSSSFGGGSSSGSGSSGSW